MGVIASKEAIDMVLSMKIDAAAGFFLLSLPNGQFAAFWHAGIEGEHAEGVAKGEYSESCAKIGSLNDVCLYIKEQAEEEIKNDYLNSDVYKIPLKGIIADTLRKI